MKSKSNVLVFVCMLCFAGDLVNAKNSYKPPGFYKKELIKCESESEKGYEKVKPTRPSAMKKLELNLMNCYKDVGNKIIDDYYSKNKNYMKKRLEKITDDNLSFWYAAYDKFDDDLGNMSIGDPAVLHMSDAGSLIKKYIESLIGIVDIYGS